MSSNDDPWLDLLSIALAAWAILVRAVCCTGILPAQQVMGPDTQDCDIQEYHLSLGTRLHLALKLYSKLPPPQL